ncbi:MAG: Bax inhibitor-1/YccA family protein [Synechococcaceae cyanobacterium SM2_3_1]|nr:Bax inhibitor-1/YccA family protein [Synechococcaceae cyanobacterium SM2_3_1]
MRTANPALNEKAFDFPARQGETQAYSEQMTIQGTVNKSFLLLAGVLLTASFTWNQFFIDPAGIFIYLIVGVIGGLIFALATIFKKPWSPITAPLYALFEGLMLGGISGYFESQFPGIVIQAVALTFGTLLALLMVYSSRLIQATENFKLGVVAATGGIALIYLLNFILGFFGVNIPFIHESGLFGILFSLFVVVVAALNLVLDFDFIEQGAEQGAPKFMEWYAAFGLMVTLIWLYLEILRLLSKLRSR